MKWYFLRRWQKYFHPDCERCLDYEPLKVKPLAGEREKKKQLVLITAVVHIRKPYTAKSNLSQRLRCFPFILLVITVETSLPAFLLLI